MTGGFAVLQRVMRETSGFALEHEKRYLVEDRLRSLMRERGIAGLDELARRLGDRPRSALADQVAEALTINETSFFRDRALFGAFSDVLIPRLMAARHPSRRLRIWCAGCSTGQEPYSLAMLLDAMAHRLSDWQVELVATDLSRSVVEAARLGVYSQFEVQRGLPVTMLLRHFTRRGEEWQIGAGLRAGVTFYPQNLLCVPRDFGPFDIVFCRNVLFYFDPDTRRRVLATLVRCVAPDGFIALGGGERVGAVEPALVAEPGVPFVFRRVTEPAAPFCDRAVEAQPLQRIA